MSGGGASMVVATYLFVFLTSVVIAAAFLLVWQRDRDQVSALWFALFTAAGFGGIASYEAVLRLTDNDPFTGPGTAVTNLLFAVAMAAFSRGFSRLFGREDWAPLTTWLPLGVGVSQAAFTVMGNASLGGAITGTGAMLGFVGSAWIVRGAARTIMERLAVAVALVAALGVVVVPAVAMLVASDALLAVGLRAKVVPCFIMLVMGTIVLGVHVERILLRLVRCSEHDPLTGLLNRAGLGRACAERDGRPCAVVIADLDHFKSVNDRHGHAAGDAVLRAMATVLRRVVRHGDAVARIGGEEFVLLLPGSSVEDGRRVADRAREALRTLAQPALHGEHVTSSMGVAAWPEGQRFERAFLAADRALYTAKRLGRDRSVVAGDAPRATRAMDGQAAEGEAALVPSPA